MPPLPDPPGASGRPPFYPPGATPPATFDNALLHLEPLTTAHGTIDYAAVMLSRAMLRIWSGSSWPARDFTLADNLADLERHATEHRDREAFTYTVLSPGRQTCLGCVYMVPNTVAVLDPRPYDALVRLWVAAPLLGGGLEGALLAALRGWLRDDFAFRRWYFHANTRDVVQMRLFRRAGLAERAAASLPGRGGYYAFFEDVARSR